MSKDIVTLSTFGMQAKWKANKADVKKFIDGQVENIIGMKKSFDAAAKESGREPPEIVLSALMIPQWKSGDQYTGQNYQTEDYTAVKDEYFEYLKEKCEAEGIRVEDFYSEAASEDEKQYLHQLEALGSTADTIKNRAIINNQGNRHLQVDTNTIVVDQKAFYKATIGASDKTQKDGMNASYYDETGMYVSPHNKVVYTSEASQFAQNLEKQHDSYVAESKDRLDRKTPSSNQVYSTGFCKAAMDSGLVQFKREYYSQWNNLWGYYPVDLANPIFEMTKHIITAINMSWSQGDGKVDYCAALKGLKVEVTAASGEKTTMDYQAYSYLIKKYTNSSLDPEDREKLLAISDRDYDEKAITSFVANVINKKDLSLLGPLLRTIPDTAEGREISEKLFVAFKNDPTFLEIVKTPGISNKVSPEDLKTLANFIPEGVGLDAEKGSLLKSGEDLLLARQKELQSSLAGLKDQIYNSIKEKLDTLGEPYVINAKDKETIEAAIDALGTDVLKDNNIEQFHQIALNAATNKVFSDKVKMQPAVQEALKNADGTVQEKMAHKIYQPPANEKFNRVEIDAMVNRVAFDVKILVAAPVKEKFLKEPNVKEFITTLNALAAIRPMTAEREAQVERMSEAVVNAIRSFAQNPVVGDMNNHLQDHYEKLQDKYKTTPKYDDSVTPEKRDTLVNRDTFTVQASQSMKEQLQTMKGNEATTEPQNTLNF